MAQREEPDNGLIDVLEHLPPRALERPGRDDECLAHAL
jgi:hypothetical protein